MPIELTAHTSPGARLVAIAEELSPQLAARAAQHDRDGTYPFEAIDALKAAGYFRAPVPVELGGLGVSSAHDLVVPSSRLAGGDASVAIGVKHAPGRGAQHGAPSPGRGRGPGGAARPRLRLVARAGRARRRRAGRRYQ
jgi:alkylation response protein AidB-like acyl-CoA dehydrogenase